MIATLGEGITQSLLPCSWTLLLPAVALGLGTRKVAVYGTFAAAVVMAAWISVVGWIVAPVWLAGLVLLAGGVLWWRIGPSYLPAVLVGVGAAWAWRPCVGAELGAALTTAQRDPVAAIGGLAMFLLGVVAVGIIIGIALGVLIGRWRRAAVDKAGAAVAVTLGLTMLLGIYPRIASTFAEWSTVLWA